MKFLIMAAMAFFSIIKVNSQNSASRELKRYMVDCGQTEEARAFVQSYSDQASDDDYYISSNENDGIVQTMQRLKLVRKRGICVLDLTLEQVGTLERKKGIGFVELDRKVYVPDDIEVIKSQYVSDTPGNPYGIKMVQADQLFDVPIPVDQRRTVCVVDTGYGSGHPDLPTKTEHGVDGASQSFSDNWDLDAKGHGTHCAGTIGAIGGNGIDMGASVFNDPNKFKFFITNPLAPGAGTVAFVIEAVERCIEAGATVISMSLSWMGTSYAFERVLTDNPNTLFIAAAGNGKNGITALSLPASYPEVMSVAAVDTNERRAYFSQYNDQVEISGPGVSVWSTTVTSTGTVFGTGLKSGTSMACPHVAGVAAALWSYFPFCSAIQIRNILNKSAKRLDYMDSTCDKYYGHGIVQLKAAYDMIFDSGCNAAGNIKSVGGCQEIPDTEIPTTPPTEVEIPDTEIPTTPPTEVLVCYGSDILATVEIITARFGHEISWVITGDKETVIKKGSNFPDNTVTSVKLCLPLGGYYFSIFDTFGDGICSGDGDCGSYKVSLNDVVEVEGGGSESNDFESYFYQSMSLTAEPTSAPTAELTDLTCDDGEDVVRVEILTDNFAKDDETVWGILGNGHDSFKINGGPYENNESYFEQFCLDGQKYKFFVEDKEGDGICSEPRNSCGHIKMFVNGMKVIEVGGELPENDFKSDFNKGFTLTTTDIPTSKPTSSPTDLPTNLPTTYPTSAPTVDECVGIDFFHCDWFDKELEKDGFKAACLELNPTGKKVSKCKSNFKEMMSKMCDVTE